MSARKRTPQYPYQVLLLPAAGRFLYDRQVWSDPSQALAFGKHLAALSYALDAYPVEILVLDTRTRTVGPQFLLECPISGHESLEDDTD